MIQANELRKGNIITHQNNNGIYLVNVLETLKNGVNVKTRMQLGEWFLRYEEVKGTPLTEDWLLKFGFIEDEHGFKKGILMFRFYESGEFTPNLHTLQLPTIKYVHQLQNLYFALTGSELVLSSVPEATKPAL